jgi:FixJ family two-component response regulator
MRALAPIVFVCNADSAAGRAIAERFADAGVPARLYASADLLLANHPPRTPGCILLCGSAPPDGGLDFYEKAADRGVDLPVIQIVDQGDVGTAICAMRAGAIDLLERPVSADLLVERTRHALARAAELRHAAAAHADYMARLAWLTARERRVLECSLAGRTAKHIADELGVALRTIQLDREHILEKMRADSLIELAGALGREATRMRRQRTAPPPERRTRSTRACAKRPVRTALAV